VLDIFDIALVVGVGTYATVGPMHQTGFDDGDEDVSQSFNGKIDDVMNSCLLGNFRR
jgi:hypothetical protein